MTMHSSSRSNSRSGSALLTVLWLTAALSAIGLAVASNVRGETERATTNVDDVKTYFIARGAIERAILRMDWGQDFYRYGMPAMLLPFPNAEVRVEIIPETSKLGLNSTPPQELLRLLEALGVAPDRALEITAAIVDWRTGFTADHPSPLDGFYLSRSPSFLPRHTSFQENEELLLVKGMTPDLYFGTSIDNRRAGLRDCVSVFGGSALDLNTAREEAMVAVGLSPAEAATVAGVRAQHPILDLKELQSLQQALGPVGGRLRYGGGTMYTFRATAQLRQPDGRLSDMRRTVAALVKIFTAANSQGKTPGYEVLRWYDRN